MKSLSDALRSMPLQDRVYTASAKPSKPSPSPRDTQVVGALFDRLKIIFPAWRNAYPTPEAQAAALQSWIKALVEAGCTRTEQISRGLQVARGREVPFFPTSGQFISWCEPTPEEMGLPSVDAALVEIRTRRFTHPAVQLAAKATRFELQTVSADEYRKVFAHAYAQLLRRAMAGEDLTAELHKGLPAKGQATHSAEFYQAAGKRGVSQLKALFKRQSLAVPAVAV
ncbi:MAG: replication protein P [Aeromonas sp.]